LFIYRRLRVLYLPSFSWPALITADEPPKFVNWPARQLFDDHEITSSAQALALRNAPDMFRREANEFHFKYEVSR